MDPPSSTTMKTNNVTKTTTMAGMMFNFSDDEVFQNPFDQPPIRITFIFLYSVVFAMCFLGNIGVLVVFAYSKRMRTRTNLFLANLAVADFCVGVFCVLPSLSINLSPFWTLGQVMCKLYFFVNYLAYTASILLLVVIAVERYIAIMHPLRSRGYFTAPRLLVAQVVVWVVAAVYNIPILLMFDTTYTPAGAFCYITLPLLNLKAYYTAHFILWYLLPLTVILVMYGRISCTLWATSAAAIPATRADSRGSVSMAMVLDTQQHGPPHTPGLTSLPKCCLSSQPGRTCVSYCETVAENGFGSVVTVGLLDGGRGGASNGRGELRGVFGSKSRLVEGEDAARRSTGRNQELDKIAQRLLACQPREMNGQVEMVRLNGCSDCFNCMHSKAPGLKTGSGTYSQRADNGQLQYSAKRSNKKHLNVEDCAYDLSDVPSSEDYDSYQSRGEGGSRVVTGAGEGNFYSGGGGGNGSAGPRRLRTHCRISSQRGLTSRRRVIRLLVAVVTIFAICVLPFHVRNLLHYWNVETTGGIFDFLSPIASVMMYLNCGLNPFIYWMFSNHFRRSLKETLCFCKRNRRSNSRMMLSSPRQHKSSTMKHYDVM